MRLSEFSGFSKRDNDVRNLNLLAGANSYPYVPKITFGNRPVSSINRNIQTNIYTHTYAFVF